MSRFWVTTNVDQTPSTNKQIQPKLLTNQKAAGMKRLSLFNSSNVVVLGVSTVPSVGKSRAHRLRNEGR